MPWGLAGIQHVSIAGGYVGGSLTRAYILLRPARPSLICIYIACRQASKLDSLSFSILTHQPTRSNPHILFHSRYIYSTTCASQIHSDISYQPRQPTTMSVLEVGDSFPDNVSFTYIPFTPESKDITSCGIPIKYNASEEVKNKKVVIVAVPGAFTPTCQASHLPGFIQNIDALKAKGVDQVIVIASNDPYVMSAWGKANYTKDDFIIFASDSELAFSKAIGWTQGDRTARYAIAVDHGKVVYAAKETERGVDVSGAEAVLAKL